MPNDQPMTPDAEISAALCRLGLLRDPRSARFTALTGGVSSDIWLVEVDGRRFCVKRALAKLKVAATVTRHGTKRREREALGMRLAHVSSLLRDLGVLTSGSGGSNEPLANAGREDDLRAVARAFPPDRLITAFGVVARAQSALDRNASPKIVADWVAVGI